VRTMLLTSLKTAIRRRVSAASILIPLLMFSLLLANAQSVSKKQQGSGGGSDDGAALAHHMVTPESLPAPDMNKSGVSFQKVVPMPQGASLRTPPGFRLTTFAEGGFQVPRWMALAPNGDVFLADSRSGDVIVLRDSKQAGVADQRFVFAAGLTMPFGLAFWQDYLYVGDTDAVLRFRYRPGQTKAEGAPEKIADLPGRGNHWTRSVLFNPAGTKMYVGVGSASNVSVEPDSMRAAISEYNPDGSVHRIYASGTRNPIGLAFYPGTRALWAAVQERDLIGDNLPPDYVTSIREGGFYGWPYSYIGHNEDPRRKGERPDLVAKATVPDVLIQAHSAVLGLLFYQGSMFPQEFRGDAFVALHGSWNRSVPTGYKIIRIHFSKGRPVGGYDDFITGWLVNENEVKVWGRPVGLLELKDGSMLIADDGGKKIWRVTYNQSGGKP